MKRWLPWVLAGAAAVWVAMGLRAPRPGSDYDVNGFGRLPVLMNGRVQPWDSVARNVLLVLRGKRSVPVDDAARSKWRPPLQMSATEWLLEVVARPEAADMRRAFKVDHPDLRSLLKLPVEGSLYVAFTNLAPHLEEVEKQAERARAVDPQRRESFEKAVIRLSAGLAVYQRLKNTLRPEDSKDFAAEVAEFQRALGPGLAAWRARQEGREYKREDLERLAGPLRVFEFMADAGYAMAVPPAAGGPTGAEWLTVGSSLIASMHRGEVSSAVSAYAVMATAYRKGEAASFNRALAEYRRGIEGLGASGVRKAALEFLYNGWQPFLKSLAIYVVVFLLGCCSWIGWFRVLNRGAFFLLWVAFVVHTAGIAFRMVIEGRPPVTNLYSSAVFVGWGAVVLGLILDWLHRNSLGIVMASAIGFLSQVVAHNLSLDGDTMEMLRAVLDTNFWLATHVVTIALGYSATFVAGFLAAIYVVLGLLTGRLGQPFAGAGGESAAAGGGLAESAEPMGVVLERMVYGIVCFATLFSFVGTVLGGIWADQSWGRFWGWDPKENGALLVVLWNAILLHARWGHLVRERGLMNLAIFGNVVTSFSWFGVNMLGVGLHAYGFMDQAFVWMMVFVASQVGLIGIGLVRRRTASGAG